MNLENARAADCGRGLSSAESVGSCSTEPPPPLASEKHHDARIQGSFASLSYSLSPLDVLRAASD